MACLLLCSWGLPVGVGGWGKGGHGVGWSVRLTRGNVDSGERRLQLVFCCSISNDPEGWVWDNGMEKVLKMFYF